MAATTQIPHIANGAEHAVQVGRSASKSLQIATNGLRADGGLDAAELYRDAVLSLHGGPIGYLGAAEMNALADAMAAVNTRLYEYSFAIAATLYTPNGNDRRPDPSRRTTVKFLVERANVSPTEARRACRAVEFVASLKIKRDPYPNQPVEGAVPSMAQVLAVVRSDIKSIGGWGKVAGWISKCWRAPASATTWTSGASSSRARRAIGP
jgi:hypothetical protein